MISKERPLSLSGKPEKPSTAQRKANVGLVKQISYDPAFDKDASMYKLADEKPLLNSSRQFSMKSLRKIRIMTLLVIAYYPLITQNAVEKLISIVPHLVFQTTSWIIGM